jgi:hypothetical protein
LYTAILFTTAVEGWLWKHKHSCLKKTQLFKYMLEDVVAVPSAYRRIVEGRGKSYTFAERSFSLADERDFWIVFYKLFSFHE